jgi:alpha-galactosidase
MLYANVFIPAFLCAMSAGAAAQKATVVWLEDLDLSHMAQDWESAQACKSVEGKALSIGGREFAHGVGTHSNSLMLIDLKGGAARFRAMVGIDGEVEERGSVTFQVWVDGELKGSTGVLRGGDPPEALSVDLAGAQQMLLCVTDAGDGYEHDHADWANAMISLKEGAASRPQAIAMPAEPPPTIASGDRREPAIHGPRIVGATPGHDFLFLIPATGEGPLTYAAENLPKGLRLDPRTGIISGRIAEEGKTVVTLRVRGPRGDATRKLSIVAGTHKLALTPPMGWNSWNVWAGAVDAEKVRAAADWMVKSGLAAHGWQYINVDDCWEGERDASGTLSGNEKFGDMKALGDYIHAKGLKFGVYSSPGPKTCGGFEGSYGHEEQDAHAWASWGVDYIKYDWCSYGRIAKDNSLEELQKPYRVMREALDKCGRDIVFSLCQYGMGSVWEWGADVGGNCWRTTGDIYDAWGSMSSIGFGQDGHEKHAGPGHWNDPDMLVVGKVGWGPNLHPTNLTPHEQMTHITLWCLLSSPLLLGCDLSELDQFTLDLLTNGEVLDVNQDPLGKPAGRRGQDGLLEVWARPLWDGTMAVGLFNRGPMRAKVTANWTELRLRGRQRVRDLWQRKDLGTFDGSFTAEVPAHGVVLVKIGTPREPESP